MDSFEFVIASLLEREGFWTQISVKVELTKDDKHAIGRHSSPRWELDVVGYNALENVLRIVECKSFLNSTGVRKDAFDGTNPKRAKRYKLFTERNLYNVVLRRLKSQFEERKFCRPDPDVELCLAAGKIKKGDQSWLRTHFERNKWILWTPEDICEQLKKLSQSAYENSIASVVAKVLLRKSTLET
jgi:hypothetical protein